MRRKRVNLKAILANEDLRRDLMVSTIQATQAREGIETTEEQADRAYYVVTEADKATFFDLERFRGGKRSEPDRREEMFVRAIRTDQPRIRFDVARRDFSSISGCPLAYRRVGIVAPMFRDHAALEPGLAIARQGKATASDARWVRFYWEVAPDSGWVPFAKGGDYCRFYYDVDLVLDWRPENRAELKSVGNGLPSLEHYFKAGLTWPRRTQRGFNVRELPEGCVFADKGPAIFLAHSRNTHYLLGVTNSLFIEYLLHGLTSFGSWEVGAIRRLPIPQPIGGHAQAVSDVAQRVHAAKSDWDRGNETSTNFTVPWVLRCDLAAELDALGHLLDHLAEHEATEESRIQHLYAELNDAVYKLYGIPDATRAIIEETLGERPPEILWPQMEKKTTEQKRMEHVWRLLSYVVKRVVEADEDGIVPFMATGGETALIDRVRAELSTLFPDQDINQVEVDITNELKRKVKGYRRVESIREWLEDVFFAYHVSLYKKRPILWHIASSEGRGAFAFGALAHYHKFDHDRLAKLRGGYLRGAIAHFRREAGLADQDGRTEDRQEWQDKLEEAQTLDQRLQWVQEGADGHPAPGDCRIRTPWKSDDELPDGWQPDLDDGVAVNILPLQTAGVLRISKVV